MRKLNIKRIREHWKFDGIPLVGITQKHASFINVKWVEDVYTFHGPMRLAALRIVHKDELITAGFDCSLGVVVGQFNHKDVIEVDGKFYMHGVDSLNNIFYKKVRVSADCHDVGCNALYEVSVVNGEVVHAATTELFTRLGLV